jgi:hypothetical protein
MKRRIVLLLACAACVGTALPAGAEWLSLVDGGLLETKGPWKEKGRMVVYTSAHGTLMSVRASEVDLPMSRAIGTRLTKTTYVDFGAAPDPSDPAEHHAPVDERQNAERSKLQQFVQDPNAPRVAGTLSAQSNETAARNLGEQLEGGDDRQFHRDNFRCEARFAGSSAYDVCLMRSAIASEIRKVEKDRKEEELADAE